MYSILMFVTVFQLRQEEKKEKLIEQIVTNKTEKTLSRTKRKNHFKLNFEKAERHFMMTTSNVNSLFRFFFLFIFILSRFW